MKKVFLVLALSASLVTGGCQTVAQLAASTASNLSSSTPSQVKTLAEAQQAATLVTNAADVYVTSANPDRGTLIEIKALSDALHAALVSLEDANAAGKSLDYSTFNAALQAYNAYMTAKGINH